MLKRLASRWRDFLLRPLQLQSPRPDPAIEIALSLSYAALARHGEPLPGFDNVGFSVYSQNEEDGILLYIFALIGATNRRCVEIGTGQGIECNTANLIINHRWTGLLVDCDAAAVAHGREFYRTNRSTRDWPAVLVSAHVTRGNVNGILRDNGFAGEIDLLSIDVDGMDYWIWDALDVISPRVVVIEFNDILGPDRSVTVPYKDDFSAYDYPTSGGLPNYAGASLAALVKLARRKGYRFVGATSSAVNAFFVKDGLGQKELPEARVADCFSHPKPVHGMRERFPTVAHLPWQEV